jgi:hypothetical protein
LDKNYFIAAEKRIEEENNNLFFSERCDVAHSTTADISI